MLYFLLHKDSHQTFLIWACKNRNIFCSYTTCAHLYKARNNLSSARVCKVIIISIQACMGTLNHTLWCTRAQSILLLLLQDYNIFRQLRPLNAIKIITVLPCKGRGRSSKMQKHLQAVKKDAPVSEFFCGNLAMLSFMCLQSKLPHILDYIFQATFQNSNHKYCKLCTVKSWICTQQHKQVYLSASTCTRKSNNAYETHRAGGRVESGIRLSAVSLISGVLLLLEGNNSNSGILRKKKKSKQNRKLQSLKIHIRSETPRQLM